MPWIRVGLKGRGIHANLRSTTLQGILPWIGRVIGLAFQASEGDNIDAVFSSVCRVGCSKYHSKSEVVLIDNFLKFLKIFGAFEISGNPFLFDFHHAISHTDVRLNILG